MSGHRPAMDDATAARLLRWHDEALAAMRSEAGVEGQVFEYLGRSFDVPPDVQPITGVSHLLGEAVLAEVVEGDRVLDLGTGCGVNAVLAASRSRDVLAVDINPEAVGAAERNAVRNGVAERVQVVRGDGLDAVLGLFDVVVFDPPFRWTAPRDLLETATADAGYDFLTRSLNALPARLRPGGRVLLFTGTTADLVTVLHLVDGAGFSREVVARLRRTREGHPVEYLTLRLRLG